ncbi:Protein CBG02913 [Caenorhabditis briggsae]|uniref:Protein CBG02913 n=1 Tax=Caenorhabditis briggsae TaxID=6238 RepID=A8WT84_CAEBR|nr:Protein CBG02913 [Caenorhabditis briggsae]CAP23695.2 Protein CBG02913 [Caenorhabditis briggsae]
MYTDFSGYEHLVEKELNHRSISLAECREWIVNKKCEYGSLVKGKEGMSDSKNPRTSGFWSTNNKVEVDYPNRFTSFFSPKRYYKENCIIIETKVYSHFNQSRPSNILSDLSNCKYQDGSCPIKKNEIMIWDVNTSQNRQCISIGKLDGIMNNGLWINSKNQIALSLNKTKIVRDCNLDLLISEEGFAVKEIQKLPSELKTFGNPRSIGLTQQALTSTPSLQEMSSKSEISRSQGLSNPQKYAESSTPRSEGLYQKEREEYYKRQREIQTVKDKEVRDKYEADRKELEKRREEKMKQYLEFEKRKKEKMERQGLLNTTKRDKRSSNQIYSDFQALPKNTIRENANFFIIFPQDKLNLDYIYRDHASEIKKDEFLEFTKDVWSKKYNFMSIDKTSDIDNGKFRKCLKYFYVF